MAISVLEAAKHIGARSHWSLSNLKMQKLLYIAHMFHLGIYNKPLVCEFFEAWDYGPGIFIIMSKFSGLILLVIYLILFLN